jgi:xanthine dehydrogenase accessory factor
MKNPYKLIAQAVAQGRSVALATVVRAEGATPREIGAKMIVYDDGQIDGTVGGGKMEALVIQEAVAAIRQGASRLVHYELRDAAMGDPGICGGVADVFVDVVTPRPVLLVVGAGHIALPVAEIGSLCGFRVLVVDDRADMASAERFPHADERFAGDIVETLGNVSMTPNTYIVIITRGHAYDEQALRAVIDSPAGYIGMIGSRRKVRTIFDHLRADGIDEALLRRIHAPIGLDIGAQTPAEIAISILAEIVMLRHDDRQGRRGQSMKLAL